MCRMFGCVASEPVSIRHELLEVRNPLIRQSQEHDSGWGMAVYERGDGEEPRCVKFPEAAYVDGDFREATRMEGRIFNAHVRRATMGGLSEDNTHPFCLGSYTFSHNGTAIEYPRLMERGVRDAAGDTDSEHLFHFLMRDFDDGDPVGSLRAGITAVTERTPFDGLNFVLSDGECLFAYRLGRFELHWLARPGQLLVASEKLTADAWHTVQQDVLLVLDPHDPEEPHAERLLGDEVVSRADIRTFEEGAGLRGAERGTFAAERAARVSASPAG